MEDASGRIICQHDLVAFKSTPSSGGGGGGRGRVRSATPGEGNTLSVVCIDGATVQVNNAGADLTVVDRSYLYPGIVVGSASDPGGGPLGVVTGVETALDLVRLDDAGRPGELRRVRELNLGDYVVRGRWLGRVSEVSLDVDVAFDGGAAVCRVTEARRKLSTVHPRDGLNRHTNSVFYPGQCVAGHWSVFNASRWLRGFWKPSRGVGTVAKVEMAGVLVYWVASPQLGADRALVKAAAPPAYQRNPRDLTFFCSPPVCFWTIGDRCFWSTNRRPPSAGPPPPPAAAAARGLTRTVMKRMRRRVGVGRRSHGEFDERPMSVASTITTADVLWQDGTRQRGVPAASLLPFTTRNDHDFLPGQHVVRVRHGGGGGDGTVATGPSAGVVRSLDCKEQTVRVAWLKPAAIHPGEPNDEFDYDEILSAYDLCIDDQHSNAFYGNVVVRVHGDGDQHHTQSDKDMGTTGDLSWVGHVTGLCEDGHVQVKWGNGNTSKVLPHQIAVVKLHSVGEMLREMGDWVHDNEDMDDNAVDNAQVRGHS